MQNPQTKPELVITVNEENQETGSLEKMQAHKEGVLHRAFSVFVINSKNEMLLQRRATGKYHSGGLWSNTCCSHPAPGESAIEGAHRRLQQEMGFDCALEHMFDLRYKAEVGNELIENEYDHIYLGHYDGKVQPAPEEAMDYKFAALKEIKNALQASPDEFTRWFQLAFPKFVSSYRQRAV